MSDTIKIKEHRTASPPGSGFHFGGKTEYRVYSMPAQSPMPGNAVVVADDTPECDWTPEPKEGE